VSLVCESASLATLFQPLRARVSRSRRRTNSYAGRKRLARVADSQLTTGSSTAVASGAAEESRPMQGRVRYARPAPGVGGQRTRLVGPWAYVGGGVVRRYHSGAFDATRRTSGGYVGLGAALATKEGGEDAGVPQGCRRPWWSPTRWRGRPRLGTPRGMWLKTWSQDASGGACVKMESQDASGKPTHMLRATAWVARRTKAARAWHRTNTAWIAHRTNAARVNAARGTWRGGGCRAHHGG
jgi:hypothetical protein